jgi:hypothetical protein
MLPQRASLVKRSYLHPADSTGLTAAPPYGGPASPWTLDLLGSTVSQLALLVNPYRYTVAGLACPRACDPTPADP